MEFLGKIVIAGLMNGSIYGLVAIGFVLVYKSSSVLNFSQGYMLLLGAYIFWFFKASLKLDLLPSLLLALPSGFLMGIAIERITLRPLIGQPLISMITVTIFLSLVLEGLVSLIWGTYPLEQITVFGRGSGTVGSIVLTTENVCAFGVAFGAMVVLILFFRYTNLGLAMRGVAEGHQIVQSMGIGVRRIFSISWGIAGVAATIGGILMGTTLGFQLGLSHIGLLAIPAAFIGGLESPEGAILGGLLIGLIESVVSGYLGNAAGVPATFVVLILVMLIRPYGFFGLERIERV
ncbi:MAG: branched-chain amino acid ABC transporter permease [Desulfomonilaceae bacterium]|nr:branched-chain amino acid ABC transporter permease [Desulfomonilaceae bacterium]